MTGVKNWTSAASTRRLAAAALLIVGIAILSAGCGGSSKPKETFKQAQAAVAKPYVSLLHILQQSASTGTDMTSQEERATDKLIASVNEHRPALGLHEARRSLNVTAYTLKVGGDMCPDCQQKLHDAADSMK